VKVNGRWAYLYRAVDSRGRTVDFYLSSRRNSKAAYRFLGKILGTVAKLAMRQPFVLFKGLTFQKLCLPGAFRPGDHHNKMLRPG
ncbi:DDE-type integrase/transposase/recombinase, partial [Klebsiella pneumoniae]